MEFFDSSREKATCVCMVITLYLCSCVGQPPQEPVLNRAFFVAFDVSPSFHSKEAAASQLQQLIEDLSYGDAIVVALIVDNSLRASRDAIHATMPRQRFNVDPEAERQLGAEKHALSLRIQKVLEQEHKVRVTDIRGAITAAAWYFSTLDKPDWQLELLLLTDGIDDANQTVTDASLSDVKVTMLFCAENAPERYIELSTYWWDYCISRGAATFECPPISVASTMLWQE